MRAANPHILMLSPSLDMAEKWFAPHTAYSMAKFGMSLVVLGSQANARENRSQCFVAAHNDRHRGDQNLLGGDAMMLRSRKPAILAGPPVEFSKAQDFYGNFLIDDTFLAGEGIRDFDRIASTRASHCRWTSLCRTPFHRRMASVWTQNHDRHFHERLRVFKSRRCPPFSSVTGLSVSTI